LTVKDVIPESEVMSSVVRDVISRSETTSSEVKDVIRDLRSRSKL